MDFAVFWLVIIGPILISLAVGIWFGGIKTLALWTGFSGAVLLMLAATLQLQQFVWKPSVPAARDHPGTQKMTTENSQNPPVNIPGSGNIVTFGQSGGQNVINQTPKPDLQKLNNSIRNNPDGSQTISILVEVIAPYPAGSLFIKAVAPDILKLEAVPQRTGMSMSGHSGKREGYAFTTLMSPFGRYMINVYTSKPEPVSIEYEFQ